jgi:phosphopantetheine adenylyltransferase
MPVPPTPENPHGWGSIETREELPYYQLSPRIQIVIGDVVKVSKGTYYIRSDGTKTSIAKHRGRWKVKGVFKNNDGDIEVDIAQYTSQMMAESATIRVTGDEYPSTVMDSLIRRPYKIKLANPRYKRKRRKTND